jgi:hypothetical protein
VQSVWRDHDAGAGECRDLGGRDGLRREGHHQRQAGGRGAEEREVLRAHRPDQRGIVGALAGQGEVGAFEMEARDPRYAFGAGLHRGLDRGAVAAGRVGDERGQERERPEPRMGLGDARERGGGGVVVQHHAAAAVDLEIDEAGRERAGAEVDRLGAVRRRADGGDPAAGDGEHARPHRGAVEDAGGAVGDHVVFVTLWRLRGRSGS